MSVTVAWSRGKEHIRNNNFHANKYTDSYGFLASPSDERGGGEGELVCHPIMCIYPCSLMYIDVYLHQYIYCCLYAVQPLGDTSNSDQAKPFLENNEQIFWPEDCPIDHLKHNHHCHLHLLPIIIWHSLIIILIISPLFSILRHHHHHHHHHNSRWFLFFFLFSPEIANSLNWDTKCLSLTRLFC